MKITFEQSSDGELEIIVRGDINNSDTTQILSFLNSLSDSGKILLQRENESYIFEVGEVVYFEACSGKTYAYTADSKYEAKEKLYELTERYSSKGFVQINKSSVVNINFVKSISAEFSGNYTARLKIGNNTLTISRKYFNGFKNFIRR